jgi:hypothetical protein
MPIPLHVSHAVSVAEDFPDYAASTDLDQQIARKARTVIDARATSPGEHRMVLGHPWIRGTDTGAPVPAGTPGPRAAGRWRSADDAGSGHDTIRRGLRLAGGT